MVERGYKPVIYLKLYSCEASLLIYTNQKHSLHVVYGW